MLLIFVAETCPKLVRTYPNLSKACSKLVRNLSENIMAKVKLVINLSKTLQSGEYMVYVQLSHRAETIRVATDIATNKDFWIKDQGLILGGKKGDPLAPTKNPRLNQIKNDCELKIMRFPERVEKMTVKQLKSFLMMDEEDEGKDTDFFHYCQKRITELESQGREKTAKLLKVTRNKILNYCGTRELDMSEINGRWLEKFSSWCLTTPIESKKKNIDEKPGKKKKKVDSQGKDAEKEEPKFMTQNGVASYLRYLRAVLNSAIEDDLITNYPFRKFKVKTEVSRNRNLSVEVIRSIRDYAPQTPRQLIARDVFMLQMYLHGINLKDLFYLKPEKRINDRLQFNRAKTGRFYNIKIEKEAGELIEAYTGKTYLLWFADNCSNERKTKVKAHSRQNHFQYADQESFGKMINESLQEIHDALKLNLPIPLTDYAVRHSFASICRTIGISKDDISLMLGHSNPEMKVTGIYINEDFERADKANRKLIDYLNTDPKEIKIIEKKKERKKTSPAVA